ncbi:MAG: BON domain-containing protein, partial [Pseudomonadota bacterium]
RSVLQERTTGQALTDVEIEISIQNRLINHSGELFRDVSVDVHEARVVLTGSVPRRADQIAATREAWAVPGVAEVTDELAIAEDSGTETYLNDVWISNQLRYHLLTDLDIRSVNFNITTVDGAVHITGLARSEAELQRVIRHAQSVPGVRHVVNHALTIDDPRRVEQLAKVG